VKKCICWCLSIIENLNKFYSLGGICPARYGDTHTAVMKHVETLKTSTCVLYDSRHKWRLHAQNSMQLVFREKESTRLNIFDVP
jgi:hypothetical protein